MSSTKPIIRKIAWVSMFPQFAVMGIIMYIFSLFIKSIYLDISLGALTYLIVSVILKQLVARNHRKGISLTKAGNYPQAIEEFQKSHHFFCKYSWVDKYRYLTLLDSSKFSYAEMAFVNIAFCYLQSGNIELSKEYYQKTLELYPNNEMAVSALIAIAAFENNPDL